MKVVKTIKLYIDGQFVRSESGQSFSMEKKGSGKKSPEQFARIALASRKDFRNAVEAAKKAHNSWNARSPFNRGQILYRMAEMLSEKQAQFSQLFQDALGQTPKLAQHELQKTIDIIIYYAGFSDKFQQLTATVNPVNGPFHNFTTAEPIGVVAYIDAQNFSLAKILNNICSIIVSGNTTVSLLGAECPAVLAPLAEVFATCDLPAGVVNLLTGHLDELSAVISTHREVRSFCFADESMTLYKQMKAQGVDNMKRSALVTNAVPTLENILHFVEYKTIWHPIGL